MYKYTFYKKKKNQTASFPMSRSIVLGRLCPQQPHRNRIRHGFQLFGFTGLHLRTQNMSCRPAAPWMFSVFHTILTKLRRWLWWKSQEISSFTDTQTGHCSTITPQSKTPRSPPLIMAEININCTCHSVAVSLHCWLTSLLNNCTNPFWLYVYC